MNDINKAIQDYINDVRKNLICNRKLKNTIVNDFRNSVIDYKEEKNITDINEIYTHFGTPQEIANNYLADTDSEKFRKAVILRRIILAAAIVCTAVLCFFAFVLSYSAFKDFNGYYIEDITVYYSDNICMENYSDIVSEYENVVIN